MKTFTVTRKFEVLVERTVVADDYGAAEKVALALKPDRFIRSAPGASMSDWTSKGVCWITADEVGDE
jgi:hypothetical protein